MTSKYSVVDIQVIGPVGLITTQIYDDDDRVGVKYKIAMWTPSSTQGGTNTVCFQASDSDRKKR